jgi:DNA modification methylase
MLGNWSNQIIHGDCFDILPQLPPDSVDMIYWDPPYFQQLEEDRIRLQGGKVARSVDEDWDKFESLEEYEGFIQRGLSELQRTLKPTGSLWISGSYHCIHLIGYHAQKMGMWFFSELIWQKIGPRPNFREVRPIQSHEQLLWLCKDRASAKLVARKKYRHDIMVSLGLSDHGRESLMTQWAIPICRGNERLKRADGVRLHSTQKPVELVRRMISVCTEPGDLILDPMAGTGTTAVAATHLRRDFLVIEQVEQYVVAAKGRVRAVGPFDIINPDA